MWKKVLAGIVTVVVGFLGYVAVQPAEYKIERQIVVNAAPEKIFPHINNARKSTAWMPWAESDPQVKMEYSGPEEGVGATTSWDSPGKMGTGQATVVETVPMQLVKTQLNYTKPFVMSQLGEITLTPATGEPRTTVRWSVVGANNFMGRLMCAFVNMDELVGKESEKGLANLKRTVEA